MTHIRLTLLIMGIVPMFAGCTTMDSNGFVISSSPKTYTVVSDSFNETFDVNDINTQNASMNASKQQIKFAHQQERQDRLSDLSVDNSYEWWY